MEIRVENHIGEVKAATEKQILAALEACGLIAEGNAKLELTQSGAVDTGNLRNSIAHKVVPEEQAVYVGTNVEYGIYIEFGTGIHYAGGRRTSWAYQDRNGDWHFTNGMKARPFIKPAIADHIDEYRAAAEQYLRQ